MILLRNLQTSLGDGSKQRQRDSHLWRNEQLWMRRGGQKSQYLYYVYSVYRSDMCNRLDLQNMWTTFSAWLMTHKSVETWKQSGVTSAANFWYFFPRNYSQLSIVCRWCAKTFWPKLLEGIVNAFGSSSQSGRLGWASHEDYFNRIWSCVGCAWYIFLWIFRTCTYTIYTSLVKREALDPRSFVETEI